MEKYTTIFAEMLGIPVDRVDPSISKSNTDKWDSMFQLTLTTRIEEAFDVFFEPEDIMAFSSFQEGIDILAKYNIAL